MVYRRGLWLLLRDCGGDGIWESIRKQYDHPALAIVRFDTLSCLMQDLLNISLDLWDPLTDGLPNQSIIYTEIKMD